MDEMIIKAVDKWMYYTQNYRSVWKDGVDVPEVLAEVKFECGFQHTASKFKEYLEKKYDTALNAWDDWAAYDPKTAESWRVKTQYIREIINELFPATEQNKED